MKIKLIVATGSLFAVCNLQSQSLLNCSGTTLENSNFIFSYSIGEIAIATLSGSGSNYTQGLLQTTATEFGKYANTPKENTVSLINDFNTLQINTKERYSNYQIVTVSGVIVQEGMLADSQPLKVSISKLLSSNYFLILKKPTSIKSFQFVKL